MEAPLDTLRAEVKGQSPAGNAIRSLLEDSIEALKEKLVSAPLEQVEKLQGEAKGFKRLLKDLTSEGNTFKTFNNGY